MSVLAPPTIVEPPASLPVSYLSVSSLNLFARCPTAWKRRYIDKVLEPPSGRMVLGSAAGAALGQHFALIIESGVGLSTEAVLDEYAASFDGRAGREDVEWGADTAGGLKDSGVGALRAYHIEIAPGVTPVSVERQIELSWEGAPFVLTGYLDLETAAGEVVDFKLTAQRFSADKAQTELQPTVYLAARRAEGNPGTFAYHTMVRTRKPYAEIVAAPRSERQLDLLTARVFALARAMEWRWLENCWAGTPPELAWLCRGCSHREACAWSLAA